MKKKHKFSLSNYEERFLPNNRKQQFKDCLKQRFHLLIGVGALIFAFALILLIIYVAKNVVVLNNDNFVDLMKRMGYPESDWNFHYLWLTNIFNLLMIPGFLVASLGIAGASRILRLLTWGEGIFLVRDFFRGIKTNFKLCLINSAVIGLYFFISEFASLALTIYINPIAGEVINYLLIAIFLVTLMPISMHMISLDNIYSLSWFNNLQNSVRIFIANFLKSILFSLLLLIVELLNLSPNFYLLIHYIQMLE